VDCLHKSLNILLRGMMVIMAASPPSHAGGFSLYTESSIVALGNYAAGISAEAADASIGWYNPAGLLLLDKQQVVVGGVVVEPNATLTGTTRYTTKNVLEPNGNPYIYTDSFTALQGGDQGFVPLFHYALPLSDRAAFGFSVVAPFGLSTNYPVTSAVRYAGTLSKFETIDLTPEFAGKITDHLLVGLGLDLQYARVKYNGVIGSPALEQSVDLPVTALDSQSNNSGDSFGVGFHSGFMLLFNEKHSRIGFNYQSEVVHQFDGRSLLVGPLADPTLNVFIPDEADGSLRFTSNQLYTGDIKLPSIMTLSGYQDINNKWALLGSIVYTGWSSFTSIALNNIAVGLPDGDGNISQRMANVITPQNYRDTWRFALGLNYHVMQDWLMRFGGGYDQTPTIDANRDIRLPDTDRWALSIGTHYQLFKNLGLDAGYTYLFANQRAAINKTTPIGSFDEFNVNATGKVNAQLAGLQVVWTIDGERPMK